MKIKIFKSLKVLLLLMMLSCGATGGTDEDLREPSDAPDQFFPSEGVALGSNSCQSPLTDTRDGTTLLMIRSLGDGRGDYEVPDGKYGVRRGELLRINCNTGEVLGIVRR